MRKFFISWKIPFDDNIKEMFENFNDSERENFYLSIIEINKFYLKLKKQLEGDKNSDPKHLTAEASFIAILTECSKTKGVSIFPESAKIYLSIKDMFCHVLHGYIGNTNFTMEDFHYDNQLREVLEYFNDTDYRRSGVYSELIGFYESLFKEYGIEEEMKKYALYLCKEKNYDIHEVTASYKCPCVCVFNEFYYCKNKENFFISFFKQLEIDDKDKQKEIKDIFNKINSDIELQIKIEDSIYEAGLLGFEKKKNTSSYKENRDFLKIVKISPLDKNHGNIFLMPNYSLLENIEDGLLIKKVLTANISGSLSVKEYRIDYLQSEDSRTNKIQNTKSIIDSPECDTNKVFLIRELLHFRNSKFCMQLTLDFFEKESHLLRQEEYQFYFYRNIFQSESLTKDLLLGGKAFLRLKDFIKRQSIILSPGGIHNSSSTYFMLLKTRLEIYEKSFLKYKILYSSEDKFSDKILQINKNLLKSIDDINSAIKNIKSDDCDSKRNCYLQKMLIFGELLNGFFSEYRVNVLEEYLESIFMYVHNNYKSSFQLANEKDMVAKHLLDFFKYIKDDKDMLETIVKKVCIKFISNEPFYHDILSLFENGDIEFKIEFSNLLLIKDGEKIFSMDLKNGLTEKKGVKKSFLPKQVTRNNMYLQIFGTLDPLAFSFLNDKKFEFFHEGLKYRVLIIDKDNFVMQVKKNILDAGEKWYEIRDISDFKEQLPEIFHEEGNYSLIDEYGSLIIGNRIDKTFSYRYDPLEKCLYKLNFSFGDDWKVVKYDSFLYKITENFEDSKFTIVLNKGNEFVINLPRYNLIFIAKKDSSDNWRIFLKDSKYEIDLNQKKEIVAGLSSSIVLKHVEDPDIKKVIFPVQQFVMKTEKSRNERLFFGKLELDELILDDPDDRFKKKKPLLKEDALKLDDPDDRFKKKKPLLKEDALKLDDPDDRFKKKKPLLKEDKPKLTVVSKARSPEEELEEQELIETSKLTVVSNLSKTLPQSYSLGEQGGSSASSASGISSGKVIPNGKGEDGGNDSSDDDFSDRDDRDDRDDEKRRDKKPKDDDSDGEENLYNQEEPFSEYYTFIHDISNIIHEKEGNHYTKTQQYQEFLIKDGNITPINMESGLYLVYMYLCKKQPEEALKVLSYIEINFGTLSGTAKEIDYIKWIIFSMPNISSDSDKKAKISTPEFTAIRLKVLSMLTEFKSFNPTFNINSVKTGNSVDDYQREQFYNERITYCIKNLYNIYHKIENNVPVGYRLTRHDKLTLLRNLFITGRMEKTGTIALYWRKLELIELELKLESLKVKLVKNKESQEILSEIEDLKVKIEKVKKVTFRKMSVKEVSLSITPEKIDLNSSSKIKNLDNIYRLAVKKLKNFSEANVEKVITSLIESFPPDEENIAEALPFICCACFKGILKEKQRNDLIEYCSQIIKANGQDLVYKLAVNTYIFLQSFEKIKDLIGTNKRKDYQLQVRSVTDFGDAIKTLSSSSSYEKPYQIKEFFKNLHSVLRFNVEINIKKNIYLKESVNPGEISLSKIRPHLKVVKNFQAKVMDEGLKIDTSPVEVKNLMLEMDKGIPDLILNWKKLQKKHDIKMSDLLAKYQVTQKEEHNYLKRKSILTSLDLEAGEYIHDLNESFLKLSVKQIGDKKTIKYIYISYKELGENLSEICEKLLNDILILANKKISGDIDYDLELRLASVGQKIKNLSISDLFYLYIKSDLNEYMKKTGLDKQDCKELHDLINKYLVFSCEKQKCERINNFISKNKNSFSKNITDESSLEDQNKVKKLADMMMEDNLVNYHTQPELMVFQYDQNIIIRKKQLEYIESLLKLDPNTDKFKSTIAQIIMGGGKSTVLLPILGLKRANGRNLSILEVTSELFSSNLAELNKIFLRLFGIRVNGFSFNRHVDYTEKEYKVMFRNLEKIILSKGVLITTKESMASLQLKLIELRNLAKSPIDVSISKKIKWLTRILDLIKTKGDLLADEFDTNFDIRKQINYTIGSPDSVSDEDILNVSELYIFLDKILVEDMPIPIQQAFKGSKSILDGLLNPNLLSKELLGLIIKEVANFLAYNKSSPLYYVFKDEINDDDKEELVKYLLNEPNSLSKKFEVYNLRHLKEQLTNLLPYTLSLKLFEHYGPSTDLKKNPIEKLVCVPYAGNNEPRDKCKDANYFKTINTTIQFILINGINIDAFVYLMKTWVEAAQYEFISDKEIKSLNDTETGKMLNEILKQSDVEITIEQINVNNMSQLNKLHELLHKNKNFLFTILKRNILSKITIDRNTISHDSFNHYSMFRTVSGVTGTPYNWRTVHYSVTFDESLSLGTDGLTKARLKHKNTQVKVLEYISPRQFLISSLEMLKEKSQRVRAIIDVGATLRGVTNEFVAKDIGEFYKDKQNCKYIVFIHKGKYYAVNNNDLDIEVIPLDEKEIDKIAKILDCEENELTFNIGEAEEHLSLQMAAVSVKENHKKTYNIKYILYYGKMLGSSMSELFAIPVTNLDSEPISLKGKNTEQINELLECSPDERFTFYDQLHTIGSDITQMPNAVAVITFDKSTKEKDFLQGAMRMRNFEGSQELFTFISPETEANFKRTLEKDEINISDIIDISTRVQDLDLLEDHFTSTIGNIDNIIYQDLEKRIRSIDKIDKMPELQIKFKEYFIKSSLEDIFKNSGKVLSLRSTFDIFDEYVEQSIKKWLKLLKSADIIIEDYELKFMEKELRTICEVSIKNCREKMLDKTDNDNEQFNEVEMQNKSEIENKLQLEQKMEIELDNIPVNSNVIEIPLYHIYKFDSVINKEPSLFEPSKEHYKRGEVNVMPLLFRIKDGNYNKQLIFDEALYASRYFLITFGGYREPVSTQKRAKVIMMFKEGDKFISIVSVYSEAEKALSSMVTKPGQNFWVVDTSGNVLGGNPPDEIPKKQQKIVEQVQFFNADFSSLTKIDLTDNWIMIDSKEKLDFMEKSVLKYRYHSSKKHFYSFKNRIENFTNLMEKIISGKIKPGVDIKDIERTKDSLCLQELDIKALNKFAKIIEILNLKDLDECVDILEKNTSFKSIYYVDLMLKTERANIAVKYILSISQDDLDKAISFLLTKDMCANIDNLLNSPIFKNKDVKDKITNAICKYMLTKKGKELKDIIDNTNIIKNFKPIHFKILFENGINPYIYASFNGKGNCFRGFDARFFDSLDGMQIDETYGDDDTNFFVKFDVLSFIRFFKGIKADKFLVKQLSKNIKVFKYVLKNLIDRKEGEFNNKNEYDNYLRESAETLNYFNVVFKKYKEEMVLDYKKDVFNKDFDHFKHILLYSILLGKKAHPDIAKNILLEEPNKILDMIEYSKTLLKEILVTPVIKDVAKELIIKHLYSMKPYEVKYYFEKRFKLNDNDEPRKYHNQYGDIFCCLTEEYNKNDPDSLKVEENFQDEVKFIKYRSELLLLKEVTYEEYKLSEYLKICSKMPGLDYNPVTKDGETLLNKLKRLSKIDSDTPDYQKEQLKKIQEKIIELEKVIEEQNKKAKKKTKHKAMIFSSIGKPQSSLSKESLRGKTTSVSLHGDYSGASLADDDLSSSSSAVEKEEDVAEKFSIYDLLKIEDKFIPEGIKISNKKEYNWLISKYENDFTICIATSYNKGILDFKRVEEAILEESGLKLKDINKLKLTEEGIYSLLKFLEDAKKFNLQVNAIDISSLDLGHKWLSQRTVIMLLEGLIKHNVKLYDGDTEITTPTEEFPVDYVLEKVFYANHIAKNACKSILNVILGKTDSLIISERENLTYGTTYSYSPSVLIEMEDALSLINPSSIKEIKVYSCGNYLLKTIFEHLIEKHGDYLKGVVLEPETYKHFPLNDYLDIKYKLKELNVIIANEERMEPEIKMLHFNMLKERVESQLRTLKKEFSGLIDIPKKLFSNYFLDDGDESFQQEYKEFLKNLIEELEKRNHQINLYDATYYSCVPDGLGINEEAMNKFLDTIKAQKGVNKNKI